MLQCLNGLRHVILDVVVAPWRENNIFGLVEVRHANQGWTKYSISSCPFFIWHLECNERCWIKNVISNFVTPKLHVEITHRSRPDFTWLDWSAAAASETFFRPVFDLWERKRLFFFFFMFDRVNWSMLTWSTLTRGPLGCARLTQRPKKVRRAARTSKGLYKPHFGSFWSYFTLSFDFLLLKNSLEWLWT